MNQISLLPLEKGSLKYGSADGGKTVFHSVEELNQVSPDLSHHIVSTL